MSFPTLNPVGERKLPMLTTNRTAYHEDAQAKDYSEAYEKGYEVGYENGSERED